MKKVLISGIVLILSFGFYAKTYAYSLDDVMKELTSLRAEVASLKSSLGASVLRATVGDGTSPCLTAASNTDCIKPLPPTPMPPVPMPPVPAPKTMMDNTGSMMPPRSGDLVPMPPVFNNSDFTSISPNISYGQQGSNDVTKLQAYLKLKGYLSISPTGNFGRKTREAIKKFQADNDLPSTGNVGPRTLAKIKYLVSQSTDDTYPVPMPPVPVPKNTDSTCANDVPSIKVIYPNGGEVLRMGQTFTAKWSVCNIANTENVAVVLQDVVNPGAILLGYGQAVDGSVYLSLPNQPIWAQGLHYKLQVKWLNPLGQYTEDASDNLFTINQ